MFTLICLETEEGSQVHFWGQSVPILGASFQPSVSTLHVHKVYGCCPGSTETPGHSWDTKAEPPEELSPAQAAQCFLGGDLDSWLSLTSV